MAYTLEDGRRFENYPSNYTCARARANAKHIRAATAAASTSCTRVLYLIQFKETFGMHNNIRDDDDNDDDADDAASKVARRELAQTRTHFGGDGALPRAVCTCSHVCFVMGVRVISTLRCSTAYNTNSDRVMYIY